MRCASSLVVSQTEEVHEEIVELLAALRQARDAQPAPPARPLVALANCAGDALRQQIQPLAIGWFRVLMPTGAIAPDPIDPFANEAKTRE
jgi:hypothetical protein